LLLKPQRNVVAMSALPCAEAAAARAWRRHVPRHLAAFSLLAVAMARPTAVVTLPTHQRSIMLVMDVSASMKATDVSEPAERIARGRQAAVPAAARTRTSWRTAARRTWSATDHAPHDVLAAIAGSSCSPAPRSAPASPWPRDPAAGVGIDVAACTGRAGCGARSTGTADDRLQLHRLRPAPTIPARRAADGSNTAASTRSKPHSWPRGVKVYTVGFARRRRHHQLQRLDHARAAGRDTLKRIAALTTGYFHAGD
jgi:Ca-activated chloride channel family protein